MRSTQDTQRALLERIRTEGVTAAYEASLAVCRDAKAPAPARATASATLFRVAGYFEKRDDGREKELHEMTPEELSEAIRRIQNRVAMASPADDGADPDDIFA